MDTFDDVESNLGLDEMVSQSKKSDHREKTWRDYLSCCHPKKLKYFILRQFYEGLPESAWIEDVYLYRGW